MFLDFCDELYVMIDKLTNKLKRLDLVFLNEWNEIFTNEFLLNHKRYKFFDSILLLYIFRIS